MVDAMSPVIVTIPGEPVAKGRPRFSGHAYTPKKTDRAEATIGMLARVAMKGRPPFTGPLLVAVSLVMGIPKSASKARRVAMERGSEWPTKRPDIDNMTKLVLDAMNKIVFEDDAQIVELTATKGYGKTPRTAVIITPIRSGI